jgi:hypothetical protein
MKQYALSRTGHSPLEFEGEELAKVYGEWWQGAIWPQYHNYAVYRTTQGHTLPAVPSLTPCSGPLV